MRTDPVVDQMAVRMGLVDFCQMVIIWHLTMDMEDISQ